MNSVSMKKNRRNLQIQTVFSDSDSSSISAIINQEEFKQVSEHNNSIEANFNQQIQDMPKIHIQNNQFAYQKDHQRNSKVQATLLGLQSINIFFKLYVRKLYLSAFVKIKLKGKYNEILTKNAESQIKQKNQKKFYEIKNDSSNSNYFVTQENEKRIPRKASYELSLQRAKILNQIVEKLSARQQIQSKKKRKKNNIQKIYKLETILSQIKRTNEMSNKQSTIYSVKRNKNKIKNQRKFSQINLIANKKFDKIYNQIHEIKSQIEFIKKNASLKLQKKVHHLPTHQSQSIREFKPRENVKFINTNMHSNKQIIIENQKYPQPIIQKINQFQPKIISVQRNLDPQPNRYETTRVPYVYHSVNANIPPKISISYGIQKNPEIPNIYRNGSNINASTKQLPIKHNDSNCKCPHCGFLIDKQFHRYY